MFKKIDATRLDVCIAYQIGKQVGKTAVGEKIHEIYAKGGHIEIHEKES